MVPVTQKGKEQEEEREERLSWVRSWETSTKCSRSWELPPPSGLLGADEELETGTPFSLHESEAGTEFGGIELFPHGGRSPSAISQWEPLSMGTQQDIIGPVLGSPWIC